MTYTSVQTKPLLREAMTNLGGWESYVNVHEMLTWYPLPADIAAELAAYRPDGHELDALPADQYAALSQKARAATDESVRVIAPPSHGTKHFRQVETNGMAAVAMLERLRGETFPLALKQDLSLALYRHDCHHCSSTFRIDTPRPDLLWRPELGLEVSVEYVSALAVNEFDRAHGRPLPWRLFGMMVVWASTYGGATPRGQQLGIPDVRPQNFWGRLMRAADVCPGPDAEELLIEGITVTYGERPAKPAPTTWDEFVAYQVGFQSYVEHCFGQLDEAANQLGKGTDIQLTAELGWRANLASARRLTQRLVEQDPILVALVRREMARYGAVLS